MQRGIYVYIGTCTWRCLRIRVHVSCGLYWRISNLHGVCFLVYAVRDILNTYGLQEFRHTLLYACVVDTCAFRCIHGVCNRLGWHLYCHVSNATSVYCVVCMVSCITQCVGIGVALYLRFVWDILFNRGTY